jgi:diaminohydroxyphosphoribosylaminopyrimidine deaminase / 5-amino-6-(5-phosphoribosylamino)uracil reductase
MVQKYMEKSDPQYENRSLMRRCLELAQNGLGLVAPNPLVGSVIVNQGEIIGEGYHRRYGGPHAEVYAIQSVKDKDLLRVSTLFVNLEPCAHSGKTPPCSDLIIEKKIPRVVIGTTDPNSLVAGKGIEKLKKAGVEVITDILSEECYELNRRFFTFHQKKRPYIILKWAQSGDGFLDVLRAPGTPIGVNWISSEVSRTLVHRWRSEEQGIMVGTNTVIMDNPKLMLSHWEGKNPVRVILDRNLRIPTDRHIWNGKVPTLVYNSHRSDTTGKTELVKLDFSTENLGNLLSDLYRREISSIIVEGGKALLGYFIRENLWDEARVFIGEKLFHKGIEAPDIQCKPDHITTLLSDTLYIYLNR